MSTTTSVDNSDSDLKCMEVWGGNGSRENHFVRPGLDIWIRSQSVNDSEAGGSDLHLLSSCSSGRVTRMMVADVCGQGSQFADLVDEFRELMKQNINTIRQTRFVREINRRLEAGSELGCFATMMIGTYFSPTQSFSLCNTGHPPPLLFRVAEQEWSVFKKRPGNLPENLELSGVADGMVNINEYQHFETKLQPGDLILSYSDAFTQCQTSLGRTLGVHGLLDRVRTLDCREPNQLLTRLVQQIQSEDPTNLAIDDATILLCQATKTTVPWFDNFLAPFRYLHGATDKTTIE